MTHNLCNWLASMPLVQAGASGVVGRYLGDYQDYSGSHDALDADPALQAEVRNAAASLVETVRQIRSRRYRPPDAGLAAPRGKLAARVLT